MAAPGGLPKIFLIRPDGKDFERLTNTLGQEREPTVSPVSRMVAFRGNRDGNYEIYRCNLAGDEQVRLTHSPGNDRQPSFSPDGKSIVFATERWGEEELAIVDSERGDRDGIFRLTQDRAVSFNPAWSPTGEWICYSSFREGQADLYLITPDGKKERRLTRDWQPDVTPSWSPDGKRIVYQTQRGPRDLPCLAIYDLETDSLRVLEEIPELCIYPNWSPDGRSIIFVAFGTRLQPTGRQLQVLHLDTGEVHAFELPHPGGPNDLPLTSFETEWTSFPLPW